MTTNDNDYGTANVLPLRAREMPGRTGASLPCAAVAHLLAAHADGGLVGEEAQRVASHVQACPVCTAEVAGLQAVLGALRDLPGQAAPAPHHDEAFWLQLAAGIDEATRAIVPAPQPSEPTIEWDLDGVPAQVVALRRRRWQAFATVGSALAVAAALLLMVSPVRLQVPEVQPAAPERTAANWFEVPVLQIEEDLGATDGDPLETLDDLDDNELELVDSVLGDGV